jgi:hypothetical protein
MEPHWPAVYTTAALRCSTLAAALRSSSFHVRSMSLSLFLVLPALSSHVSPLSCLPLCAFPPLCSPPALFRVQLLRSCDKQRFAILCGLSLASTPAPADAPLTHQIALTTWPSKAWPSLPSTPISWSTAVVRRCLRGTCAWTRH